MRTQLLLVASLLASGAPARAAAAASPSCEQIVTACKSAGFRKGGSKEGKGLWVNCVRPLMRGEASAKAVLPLPSVDAALLTACKTDRPKFGERAKGGGKPKL